MALDNLSTDYDFIVIDCPPGLGALTDNALLATGRVLIPAETKGTSKRAVELLRDQIDSLEMLFPEASIQPVGVVVNDVRQDGVSN
jgi:chromosome partitioning protein